PNADPVAQELLGGQLDPAARAGVLMVKGEARRAQGDRDDARTQLELAQKVAGGTPAGRQAAVRQARVDFEIREYGQAVTDLTPVLNARPAPDLLLPALLLQGEAAYQAGDFMAAGAALRRWLGRAPFPALFGRAHAALGIALLSQGKRDEALREFTLAQKDGSVALGELGVASLALAGGRRDEAERLFTAVRNAGTPDEVAAATYGLAVVAFAKGGTRDFKAPAQAALSATPSGPAGASRAAPLLYALTAIAVEDKDWPGAFG